ncbi:MAG: ABC transporter ATP-binding protein [Halobacteriota archaeon]|nr:ABC transporter ATP-binding protein [Halobacteriota archaeon]
MIRTEDLVKVYTMGEVTVPALKGVTLTIDNGEFVAIIGPSGSGKSTLLNMIGCLDRPTSGRVIIEGYDTSMLDDNDLAALRRKKIGFIFQQFNLIRTLSAAENVALPMMFDGVDSEMRMRRAEELLEIVGLGHRKNHKPQELSGGEQQRVSIARALSNGPEIIFGDEPTGNLDSRSGEIVMRFLEELNRKGETLVIVTHDSDVAKRADRILNMKDGMLVVN